MAKLKPKKLILQDINNGNEYSSADGIHSSAVNAPIEAVAYIQKLSENPVDCSNANGYGYARVSVREMSDGTPQFKFENIKGETGLTGAKGPKGDKGDKGDPFSVARTYTSVAEMRRNEATDGVPDGGFVIITTSSVEDPENAELYVKEVNRYNFITDMSGKEGIKGDTGATGPQGPPGEKGEQGFQGATFIPSVSNKGVISWTNTWGLANPTAVDINGLTAYVTVSTNGTLMVSYKKNPDVVEDSISDLGRVQGASLFFTTSASSTSISRASLSPADIYPLIGDHILCSNGDLYEITGFTQNTIQCKFVVAIKLNLSEIANMYLKLTGGSITGNLDVVGSISEGSQLLSNKYALKSELAKAIPVSKITNLFK